MHEQQNMQSLKRIYIWSLENLYDDMFYGINLIFHHLVKRKQAINLFIIFGGDRRVREEKNI